MDGVSADGYVTVMMKRRGSEAALRFQERRQREHDAPRLKDVVPNLATLRFDVTEGRGATNSDPKHTRIIMVDTSPALFVMGCADRSCKEGGYDLTDAILRGLHSGSTQFEVDDTCNGSVGSAGCGRSMHVVVTATYR
jgi:hypothetical protein